MNPTRAILAICLLLSGCSSCGPREQSSAGGAGGTTKAPPAAAAPAGKIEGAPPQAAGGRQPNAPAPAAEAGNGGAPAAAPQAGAAPERDDCVVVADVNPDFGPPPLAVTFTAEAECGQGPTYKWDFGDGSSPSTEANPTHTYTKDGDYTASVTVTGPNGATSSDEIDIFVEQD
jgi:hypothetical protein